MKGFALLGGFVCFIREELGQGCQISKTIGRKDWRRASDGLRGETASAFGYGILGILGILGVGVEVIAALSQAARVPKPVSSAHRQPPLEKRHL